MRQGSMKVLIQLTSILLCTFAVTARRLAVNPTFDVRSYGANADGVTDNSQAFLGAWKAACSSIGDVKLLIPPGNYFLNPVKFYGPCPNVSTLTVYQEGVITASTDLSLYQSGNDWIEFGYVEGLRLTGGGTFDGQGSVSWSYDQCPVEKHCNVLPTSVKFVHLNDTIVYGMRSINPKFFHIAVLQCQNFKAMAIHIEAPEDSPNTDGIHIERSSDVTIHDAIISTGDDCISIGQGNTNVLISRINCGPGHGISIGSLGKYPNEEDVRNVVVKDSKISNTMNGVRIKTWQNSPSSSSVADITFENILMSNVQNPIIIDQTYCPDKLCDGDLVPSRVSISDVYFKAINGTSASQVAVTLNCSPGIPCQNITLQDILLTYVGGKPSSAFCAYANARFFAPMLPLPCN
ncbi:Pectin lyase-like superfamily protein [Rhynchospora pubera]|uniref:Exopolygalacturonase n=1 Tax=Rhynchospora pubera TaxID=906938 RepID=A0AAV8FFW0_9POAL|nr:Pectin lyase-like superfamily protein [Rhynchospora pubera]